MDRRKFDEVSFERLFYPLNITVFTYITYILYIIKCIRTKVKENVCDLQFFINNKSGSVLICSRVSRLQEGTSLNVLSKKMQVASSSSSSIFFV